jgi:serine/threonine protein kinase
MQSSVSETLPPSILKLTMLIAHAAAYNKAQILHRDISAGNILITEEGSGILIDWDLSKKVKVCMNADARPRRHSRTVSSERHTCYVHNINRIAGQGTWQFISIARLLDPWSRPHEVSDDLESFFWVLMYQVVRYRNTDSNLTDTMRDVFDYHSEPDSEGIVEGGKGKLACVKDMALSSSVIKRFVKTSCSPSKNGKPSLTPFSFLL